MKIGMVASFGMRDQCKRKINNLQVGEGQEQYIALASPFPTLCHYTHHHLAPLSYFSYTPLCSTIPISLLHHIGH